MITYFYYKFQVVFLIFGLSLYIWVKWVDDKAVVDKKTLGKVGQG